MYTLRHKNCYTKDLPEWKENWQLQYTEIETIKMLSRDTATYSEQIKIRSALILYVNC